MTVRANRGSRSVSVATRSRPVSARWGGAWARPSAAAVTISTAARRSAVTVGYFLKRLSNARRMSPGRVESGEASRSTVTRSENAAHSLAAFLSAIFSGIGCVHSKRRPGSKCVHWRQAWMAARQFGHCSSDKFAIGRTAPHAAHRETVCLASMPPPRGASAGGRGGGDGRRGSGFELRYPCWRYLRSLMAGKCIVGGVPSAMIARYAVLALLLAGLLACPARVD